jgi:hypothetical protein
VTKYFHKRLFILRANARKTIACVVRRFSGELPAVADYYTT